MTAQNISQLLTDKKVIAFDFDGTLVDTMGAYTQIVEDILRGYEDIDIETSLKEYIETCGLPFVTQLVLMFPEKTESFREEVNDAFEKRKIEVLKGLLLEDAVYAALKELKQKGLTLVLSSSTSQILVEGVLERYSGLFDLILGFRPPDFVKGSAHFGEIMRVFDVSRDEIVYVGDSVKDYAIAREFGLDFVGKLGTFTEERFLALDGTMILINEISDLV